MEGRTGSRHSITATQQRFDNFKIFLYIRSAVKAAAQLIRMLKGAV